MMATVYLNWKIEKKFGLTGYTLRDWRRRGFLEKPPLVGCISKRDATMLVISCGSVRNFPPAEAIVQKMRATKRLSRFGIYDFGRDKVTITDDLSSVMKDGKSFFITDLLTVAQELRTVGGMEV